MPTRSEVAYFGAGCFWGVEAKFRTLQGVISTSVGYQGGDTAYPSYEDVCTGNTNHVEVVAVTYDPDLLPYTKMLDTFWKCHNPTTLNRQGMDVGTQYRSVIFYTTNDQKECALNSMARQNKLHFFRKSIVTDISAAKDFYLAEDYHQQYLEKRGLAKCKL